MAFHETLKLESQLKLHFVLCCDVLAIVIVCDLAEMFAYAFVLGSLKVRMPLNDYSMGSVSLRYFQFSSFTQQHISLVVDCACILLLGYSLLLFHHGSFLKIIIEIVMATGGRSCIVIYKAVQDSSVTEP